MFKILNSVQAESKAQKLILTAFYFKKALQVGLKTAFLRASDLLSALFSTLNLFFAGKIG